MEFDKQKPFSSSRRKFVGDLTKGIGSMALLPGALAACAQTEGPLDRKLGVALVGLGNYSNGQLAPALQETSNCYLSGIVTGTPTKAKEWAEKYNIPQSNIYNYENFDRIKDNPEIDIVYVVLPNAMHAEFTIRAAKAGKHVLCEKPMAVDAKEAQKMVDACKDAGVKLAIGYRLHYEPHNMEMMRIGQERVFGEPKYLESTFGFPLANPNQWRLKKELSGGGALMDVGIYAIQGACYTYGMDPVAVTAQEFKTNLDMFAEVDETITWQLEFPGGIIANSSTSYNIRLETLKLYAKDGWAELGPAYGYNGLQGKTSNGAMEFPQVREQALHMDDFARSVALDLPVKTPGELGVRDMKIIDGIYQSIATGQKVQLSLL